MTTIAGLLSPLPRIREFTPAGVVSPGAKLYTYATHTTTPLPTYNNADLAIGHQNTNPVVADSFGLFGPIFLTSDAYYFNLTDALGNVLWDQQDVSTGGLDQALVLTVAQFGAVGDNVTDDGPAFNAALAALPAGGGIILVQTPAVKYAIATKVTITKPVWFLGEGPGTIVRANAALTAIMEANAGGAGSRFEGLRFEGNKTGVGGTVQRGVYLNGAQRCVVTGCVFSGPVSGTGLNFGVDINGVNSGQSTVIGNRFERLVSSTGNGTAVLIEVSNFNLVEDNEIDGSEFNNADGAPGAAIFLTSSSSGGVGSVDNKILNNRIHNHPQAGIDINSTTYCQFSGNLGACDHNVIEDNDIYSNGAVGGGDSGSGIVIVGNSNFNIVHHNKVHGNGAAGGGYGIALSGSQGTAKSVTGATNATPIVLTVVAHGLSTGNDVGVSGVGGNTAANGEWIITVLTADTYSLTGSVGNGNYTTGGLAGLAGSPKISEAPNYNQITENNVYNNYDHGLSIKGATSTNIADNFCYENGQRTANTFSNIEITKVGTGATGNSNGVSNNFLVGAQVKYQVEIAAGPTGCVLNNNRWPAGATGSLNDGGTSTVTSVNLTS